MYLANANIRRSHRLPGRDYRYSPYGTFSGGCSFRHPAGGMTEGGGGTCLGMTDAENDLAKATIVKRPDDPSAAFALPLLDAAALPLLRPGRGTACGVAPRTDGATFRLTLLPQRAAGTALAGFACRARCHAADTGGSPAKTRWRFFARRHCCERRTARHGCFCRGWLRCLLGVRGTTCLARQTFPPLLAFSVCGGRGRAARAVW